MYAKIVRYTGTLLIILTCATSIYFALVERELNIQNEFYKKLLSYPSYFEDRLYDFRASLTRDDKIKDERMVLATIDDYSIQQIGRFPWTRTVWAELIDKLKGYGAKIIAFDVFFPEPERFCSDQSSPDEIFAKSIRGFQEIPGNKVIFGYSTVTHGAEHAFAEVPGDLFNYVLNTKEQAGGGLTNNKVSKSAFPIELLAGTEAGFGHIQATEDADGIYRHYHLLSNIDGIYFPSMALLAYQLYTGDDVVVEMLGLGDAKLKTNHGTVPLNTKGETKVRWLGDMTHFDYIKIHDLLQADPNDQKIKDLISGKIIFVASTAFGAHDLRHTPVDPMLPGVFFHMNMLNMLLDGRFHVSNETSSKISWGVLLIGTLLMVLIQLLNNAILDFFVVMILTIGIFLIDTFLLVPLGYEIKLFFSLFSIGATYSWNTLINFYFANRDKAFLKNAFGNYISPELIDIMHTSGESPKLGGDVGVLTAYFTDIQSFSTFSEKLNAESLVALLNEYLTPMTDILLERSGTLDKYEGDAIIAFFGAPMKLEDHATRGCVVACRMQRKLLELRKKWVSEGDKWPEIVHNMRMRIGINSGEIMTGNMGSASRMNYTMMGDPVNLAARLEEAAKQYGIFTHVSKQSKDLCDDRFLWRELDTIRVVGKSEPVTTFELLEEKEFASDLEQKLVDKFHEGLALYKDQKWDEAIATFEQALELEWERWPDLKGKKTNPSEVYIDRCKQYKENPPGEDWDGVYTLTSK